MTFKMSVEEKLKNLPRIYVNSFEKNEGRREVLKSHFFNLGVENYSFVITTAEQDAQRRFVGDYHYTLDPKIYLVTAAYLETIRHWYETTDEEYALFLEDDVWFETAKYWNFTWDDFVNKLPKDWECIHLGSTYAMNMYWNWTQLIPYIRRSVFADSMLMSLIRRPYAKKLIENYIVGENTYDLAPKKISGFAAVDPTTFSYGGNTSFAGTNLAETLIYMTADNSYRILLFSANPYYSANSSIRPTDFMIDFVGAESKPVSLICSRFSKGVIKWWENIGCDRTVDDILSFDPSIRTPNFDWSSLDPHFVEIIKKEIFENRVYEKHGTVNQGDIVFDVGANCGAFTYSIMKYNPKHVYCFEPSNVLINNLGKNVSDCPVTIINKAISSTNDDSKEKDLSVSIYSHVGETYGSVTFKKFVEDYEIPKIDFLKFDCEGGEYDIYTDENFDYITKNTSKHVGEWHFSVRENSVQIFIKFRDTYLKSAKFFKVYDRYDNDVTEMIWDDQFLNWFEGNYRNTGMGQFILYFHYK